jgi:hypothetical protein
MTVEFSSPNASLFHNQGLEGFLPLGGPLNPHTTITKELPIGLDSQDASSFSSFYNTYKGQITAHIFLTVEVSTFLDPAIGREKLGGEQDLPLA